MIMILNLVVAPQYDIQISDDRYCTHLEISMQCENKNGTSGVIEYKVR
jgi:hypothetical protein